MPLHYSAEVDQNGRIGLWRISESVEVLEKAIEMPPQAEVPRHKARRKEFLASRCLIRELLQQTGETYRGVSRGSDGAPKVVKSGYRCSISHEPGYAAALIHKEKQPGIDIAEIDEQVLSVAHRFLSTKEQQSCRDLRIATLYWAAKEAIYKYTKGRLKDFKLMRIDAPLSLKAQGQLRVQLPEAYGKVVYVSYFFFKHYVVAYICSEYEPISS